MYDMLDDAEKATIRAAGLTKRLLTFSKGGMPIKERSRIADITCDSAEFALSDSNVRCDYIFADNAIMVDMDTGQIGQVIQNLIINGAQAMPNGGMITVRTRVMEVSPGNGLPVSPGSYVKISVIDHGVGIPPENLPRVFDPFFTTKPNGHGLGLAAAYSIISQHRGHTTVESSPGDGTTFNVYLPVSDDAAPGGDSAPTALSRFPDTPQSIQSERKLVDDVHLMRDFARRALHRAGFQVDGATTELETLGMFETACTSGAGYDIVLLDLTISGGRSGAVILVEMRKLDPTIRAVVCSGFFNDPVMSDHRRYGIDAAIAKPFTPQSLVSAVGTALHEQNVPPAPPSHT